jgi:hypothetical protein
MGNTLFKIHLDLTLHRMKLLRAGGPILRVKLRRAGGYWVRVEALGRTPLHAAISVSQYP